MSDERVIPPPFATLDLASDAARDRGRVLVGLGLGAGVLAAILEVTPWEAGDVDISALAAATAFLIAMTASLALARMRPEVHWHASRAVAEAAICKLWQWAMGVGDFACTDEQADERLHHDLSELASGVGADSTAIDVGKHAWLRRGTDEERTRRYIDLRLAEQHAFYACRSRQYSRARAFWLGISVLAQIGGVVVAILKGIGWIRPDLLGIAAAIAASSIAWSRARDYEELGHIFATMERLLQVELHLVRRRVGVPVVVARVETLLATEHQQWLARRTVLGLRL